MTSSILTKPTFVVHLLSFANAYHKWIFRIIYTILAYNSIIL